MSTETTASQSLADAMEAVVGGQAEDNVQRRITSYAKHRGRVLSVSYRVQFSNGSVVVFQRQPGQTSWTVVHE
jgi:hypothetical protein